MTAIATLTMNPTLDKSTRTDVVVPEHKLRCDTPRVEPGGGGVNVSRAVHKLGGDSLLIHVAGGLQGRLLEALLDAEQLDRECVRTGGETREAFTVLEEASTTQYRFVTPGPTFERDDWERVLATVADLEPAPRYLVASGSLPPGVPDDFHLRLAAQLATAPTRLVVDTSGPPLHALAGGTAPVHMVKPNLRELGQLADTTLVSDDDVVAAARRVLERSGIEVVVVSLGGAGAIVVADEGATHVRSPTVPIASKIGAGDSSVAGITLALSRGLPLFDAVRFGVAAGASAVMTDGTELCRRDDTERLYTQLQGEAPTPLA